MGELMEIGGFFGLEMSENNEYYADAIKLNSARSAIQYIIKAQNLSLLYIPSYICNSVIEAIESCKIKYQFYNINNDFEMLDLIRLNSHEKLLYVNYFGLKNTYVNTLCEKYKEGLILDNSQAFYKKPIVNIDTFYSPRKFFGVSQGGYLFTNSFISEKLEKSTIDESAYYLLQRQDSSGQNAYYNFQKNEENLRNTGILLMSKLTECILSSISYEKYKDIRERNFKYLHKFLESENDFRFDFTSFSAPLGYPFLSEHDGLREYLISKKVYIATYWPEVLDRVRLESIEGRFTKKLLLLPIDQRYDEGHMQEILKFIQEFLGSKKVIKKEKAHD